MQFIYPAYIHGDMYCILMRIIQQKCFDYHNLVDTPFLNTATYLGNNAIYSFLQVEPCDLQEPQLTPDQDSIVFSLTLHLITDSVSFFVSFDQHVFL